MRLKKRCWMRFSAEHPLLLGCLTFFLWSDLLTGEDFETHSSKAIASLEQALTEPEVDWNVLIQQSFADVALTRQDASKAESLLAVAYKDQLRQERAAEMDAQTLEFNGRSMPFFTKVYGELPEGGRSLFISMHGGGGAPTRVNDRQWENQKTLYTPEEGVYVAPRAPTDTWNLWHQSHIDPMFARLIQNMVVFHQVNPDRVYLMGYSAGGDGVYQLAPRMADHYAAAAMMAGHPNETSPLGLRNLPFALFMGGKDAAYKRNEIAGEWEKKLAALQSEDPNGYTHWVEIFPEFGHWMQKKDAVGLPWMQKYHRQKYPDRIVWKQDDVLQERFYWLSVPLEACKERSQVIAHRDKQVIRIQEAEVTQLTLRLHDEMMDLDQTVSVLKDGALLFQGKPVRTIQTLVKTLLDRGDPTYLFSSEIPLRL